MISYEVHVVRNDGTLMPGIVAVRDKMKGAENYAKNYSERWGCRLGVVRVERKHLGTYGSKEDGQSRTRTTRSATHPRHP